MRLDRFGQSFQVVAAFQTAHEAPPRVRSRHVEHLARERGKVLDLQSQRANGVTGVGVELFPASAEKVIAGVATGVGFLGAGIIFRMEMGSPRGLTTAASSWAATAIGVLCGSALYLTAALSTVLTLIILESDRIPVVRSLLESARGQEDQPDDGHG